MISNTDSYGRRRKLLSGISYLKSLSVLADETLVLVGVDNDETLEAVVVSEEEGTVLQNNGNHLFIISLIQLGLAETTHSNISPKSTSLSRSLK